jgi:hypothetical protein
LSTDRLDCELWILELSEFIEECERATETHAERILRRFASLQSFAPAKWREKAQPTIKPHRLEQLINASAFESAAIGLLGPSSGYMLSRSADGNCIGSVWLQGGSDEYHARSDSEGIALVAAFATGLFASLAREIGIQKSGSSDHLA